MSGVVGVAISRPLPFIGTETSFAELFGDPDTGAFPVAADRKVRYPWQYGAVGDGTTDDTAALQSWIDDNRATPNGISVMRNICLDGGHRNYRVTGPVNFRGMWHADIRNLRLSVDGTGLADVLLFEGLAFSTVANVYVRGHDGGSFGDTVDYVFRVEADIVETSPGVWAYDVYGVSTMNRFIDCRVIDLKYKHGYACGPNSRNFQCDNTQFFGSIAYGGNSASSVDTTWWQNGFLFGSGTSGNILNFDCYGCISNKNRYGFTNSSTNVRVFGGCAEGAEVAYRHGGAGSFTVSGQRNETCQRFYESMAAGDVAPLVTLQGIEFHGNALASDDDWIVWQTSGVLHLIDIDFRAITNTPQVRMSNSGVGKTLLWDGCVAPFAPKDSHNISGTAFTVQWRGWNQVDGSGLYVASFPMVTLGESPVQWSVGTSAPDVGLYRRTATGVLYSSGYLESTSGFQSTDAAAAAQQSWRTRVTGDTQYRHYAEAGGRHWWGAGGSSAVDTNLYRGGADLLATDDVFQAGDGTYNGGHLRLGSYHLWVDGSGNLRIKSSAPASATDGTVVGTQT